MRRLRDERGFTLIELLVVVVIIGIIASIALPSFLNQRGKAYDVEAKNAARTAQETIETYYTDNSTYNTSPATLRGIEPALQNASGLQASGTTTTFTVSVASRGTPATRFSIARASDGTVTRTCDNPGATGCPAGGMW